MRSWVLTLVLMGTLTAPAHAWHTEYHKLLKDSTLVLEEILSSADETIPSRLLSNAKAVIVIPTMLKGGFIFGARYGEGVASVRNSQTGQWSPPAFITTAGVSFGFQAGAQAVDLVLLVMSERGINGLLRDKFTLGGDIALTAGPLGRYAEAGMDLLLQGEIYSYSRSKGLFGGVSLKGTVIQPNEKAIKAYYGSSYTAQEIMITGNMTHLPPSGLNFIKDMNRLAPPPYNPNLTQLSQADPADYLSGPQPGTTPTPTTVSPAGNTGDEPQGPLW
ncbi:MAG: lipid-binding SYLF domain-containing protein [Nitrospinaceae bacterium]